MLYFAIAYIQNRDVTSTTLSDSGSNRIVGYRILDLGQLQDLILEPIWINTVVLDGFTAEVLYQQANFSFKCLLILKNSFPTNFPACKIAWTIWYKFGRMLPNGNILPNLLVITKQLDFARIRNSLTLLQVQHFERHLKCYLRSWTITFRVKRKSFFSRISTKLCPILQLSTTKICSHTCGLQGIYFIFVAMVKLLNTSINSLRPTVFTRRAEDKTILE